MALRRSARGPSPPEKSCGKTLVGRSNDIVPARPSRRSASERRKSISIIDEMKRSYLDYMSVIVSRALPDARDGLKPVLAHPLFGGRMAIRPTRNA